MMGALGQRRAAAGVTAWGVGDEGERQGDLRADICLGTLFYVEVGGRGLPRVRGPGGAGVQQSGRRNSEDRGHKPQGGVAVMCPPSSPPP